MEGIRKWPFGRRVVGDRGIITAKHQKTILELMRAMIGQGNHTEAELVANLDAIREYLATPKDTLSDDGRDYREKTLGRWLMHWPDQLHRAQSYLDMKRRNVVRMPITQP